MSFYTTKPSNYPKKDNLNTEDEYFGEGWDVKKVASNDYVLSYLSGALQGELKSISISQEDFELAKSGKMTLDQLCIKYDVF